MILRMVSFRAWWTKGVAVAFMYCSISVLASVVALNNVVASSGNNAQAEKVILAYSHMVVLISYELHNYEYLMITYFLLTLIN